MIPALRWAEMRAILNVSVGSDGQNHKTVSTNHNLSEEKGEPKRYRTEILPFYRLTAGPNRLTMCTVSINSCLYMLRNNDNNNNGVVERPFSNEPD